MTQTSTLERRDEVNLKGAQKPRKIFFSIEHEQQEARSFIGNVKASCFISLALNLHWESAHGIGNKTHPSPKAARCNRCLAGSCFK